MRRFVWLLWDGASAVVTERFLAEGALPNLARLCARGARGATRITWPCAQTPPATATLLTGAPPTVHRVFGYRQAARPRSRHSITAVQSGFDATHLAAEPLWRAASRGGLTSALVSTPLASPLGALETTVAGFDGYANRLAGPSVLSAANTVACAAPPPPPGEPPLDDARGFRSELRLEGMPPYVLDVGVGRPRGSEGFTRAWVSDGGVSTALVIGEPLSILASPTVGVILALFAIEPDGRDLMLFRSGAWRMQATRAGAAEALVRDAGPFLGEGARAACSSGALGPTLREGGSGVAEQRFLTVQRASSAAFRRATAHVLREHPVDLTIAYEPCIDETSHLLLDLAMMDPGGADARAAPALAVLREAYQLADLHLGAVLDVVGDDAIVAVAADHGQESTRWLFRPNVLLREHGFLDVADGGGLALERTRAAYGPAANGYLLVNSDDRPGGVVARERVREVAREAASALLGARAPDGSALLRAFHLAGESTSRGLIPDDEAGDAFLVPTFGVALSPSLDGPFVEEGRGGQHTTGHDELPLDAFFAVGGPEVPRVGRLPERIDAVDIAPTLAKLAGLPRPADATGKCLL
jgi:predicted AlkP superfamily phosphohydrolase/phosphomutase